MKKNAAVFAVVVFILAVFSGCIETKNTAPVGKESVGFSETITSKPLEEENRVEDKPEPENSFLDEITEKLIPTGRPEYSDGSLYFAAQLNSLNKMAEYNNEISLSDGEDERFKKIASQTFCEFCCGPAEIDKCGCRHAAGYRGIVKYLIKNFPEYSDEKIIQEQEKWKASFFQKGTIYKYLKEQNAMGNVSEEQINEIEEMIGTC